MNKLLIAGSLLTVLITSAMAQSPASHERIALYSKVWGFLKYHHPTVAAGGLDWDSVFLQSIQSVKEARSNADLNKILEAMIDRAGRIEAKKKKEIPDSLFLANRVDVAWFKKSAILGHPVKEKLSFIYANMNEGDNKYIKIEHQTANYEGEKKYEEIVFPDESYRLLFLSRFWNIINYYAPYKFLALNWDGVLKTFIPKMIAARDSISYYKTLMELCKSLKDGHSQVSLRDNQSLTDLIFGNYIIPFYCSIVESKVVIRKIMNDSVANVSNLQVGDIVLRIDNEEISKVMATRRKFISSSNSSGEMLQLSRYLLDGPTTTAQLLIRRGTTTIQTKITRIPSSQRNWGELINYRYNDVGYNKTKDSVLIIYAMQIWKGNIDTMKQLIEGSRAVIFDVRNYPQNDEFYSIVDPFLPEPVTIDYATIAIPDLPGYFEWKINKNRVGHINNNRFKGKVVILADERTQSQGEYSCMVLQTIPGVTTIGRQTGGLDGVYTSIPVGGGISLSYSGYGVYYPDKTRTQGKGIRIDIPVKASIDAVREGKDETLEKAFQYINR